MSDCYQHLGLGAELVRRLIEVGRDEKLKEIEAIILPENTAMQSLANRFGFQTRQTNDPAEVAAVLQL